MFIKIFFSEYNNILFLENRYTDWVNYYPWLTLKNLWDLCSYVPLQKLQIEFLNTDRNGDKYSKDDSLAPSNYSYEYVFAITMFANPLCWFEPSALGEEAMQRYSRMIRLYMKYRDEILEGDIFPLGNRPLGYSWTGFQSHNIDKLEGYIIVYREYSEQSCYSIKPFFMDGFDVHLESLTDDSENINIKGYDSSGISICLDIRNSFRLYRYVLSDCIF